MNLPKEMLDGDIEQLPYVCTQENKKYCIQLNQETVVR